ncbi:ABC transporter ATP-binding protein [Histidinibacterium aquaticum]|uniref:ABC transporter ATP-binding protein n=1 Tax=Histidinibacterium aquaticum TaxID=2613962 RepID=A0A5J5GKR8_9RHOB|nr:ABC transporter ATP-binding protein [Histidinibacterium aquaticum]KAA9008805.1 ABC transporter ATP-binding protein [Histidinibacterium aquaticum]
MANVTFRNVRKSFGEFVALEELDLHINEGEFVALLGPSGCGKSTTLRMLAGLEFPTSGEIMIGDRVVNDLAPGKRDIAMVFQSYALYPHMSVGENIGYPLKKRGIKGRERDDAVQKAAELLQLDALLDRKPKQLSGGQQQRVALGRALVRDPQVFLLDEPLSNLDAKLRSYMRAELIELHRRLGKTMVYVTHDQLEAMTMASRIAVMHGGRVQQFDTPDAIYNRPANRFVAGFIGTPPMNQVEGTVEGGHFITGGHKVPIDRSAYADALRDGPVVLGVRPEAITIGKGEGLPATVRLAENTGHETIVTLELPDRTRISARVEAARRLDVGHSVALTFDPDAIHLFEASATGARLNLDAKSASVVSMRSK